MLTVKLTKSSSSDPQDTGLEPVAKPAMLGIRNGRQPQLDDTKGGVSATVSDTVSDPFPRRWGRSRPYVSLREGSPAAPAGRTTTPGAHGRSTARHAAGGRLES